MSELRIFGMVSDFPMDESAKNRMQLLSKVEIISCLSRNQEQFERIENIAERENVVKQYLGQLVELEDGELIPSLYDVIRSLQISDDFVQDYNKVQVIKENVSNFNETYE